MPWITVTVGPQDNPDAAEVIAHEVTVASAAAAGLSPSDVVVLVHVATAASGAGATVTIAGRQREEHIEHALRSSARDVVARRLAIDPDLVAHTRL